MAMLVRYLIRRLLEREDEAPKGRGKKVDTYMRVWERRKRVIQDAKDGDDYLNYEGGSACRRGCGWISANGVFGRFESHAG